MKVKEPVHILNLRRNLDEIKNIIKIHKSCVGATPGRKYDVEVLNKAAVVLLVATWEAFVEDLASASFDVILEDAESPKVFTKKVLGMVTRIMMKEEDDSRVWDLANDGWKNVLEEYRDSVLDRYVGKLNTPKPNQIDKLFEELIGLKQISETWNWAGTTNSRILSKIEKLVSLRGEIAHRVSAKQSTTKHYVLESIDLVLRMATISSNRVGSLIQTRISKLPWSIYKHGATK
jgi:hypothetical protein